MELKFLAKKLGKHLVGNEKVSTFAPAIERDAVIKDNENKNFQENLEGMRKRKQKLPRKFGGNEEKALPLHHVSQKRKRRSSLKEIA